MHAFSLDPASGISVKLQLKAQVKYQILAGLIRPGDQLPPLRDLAAGLGINLNTVVRAFRELEEEGFLFSHQGKGVFVGDSFPGQGHGAALRSLLAGVLQPARAWGIGPEELAMALMAQSQLARPPQTAAARLLLVGGARPQLRRLQGQLEATLPVVVESCLADELPEKVRSADFAVVAATLFHQADVARHLPKATLIPLAAPAETEQLAAAQALPPGSLVVVAAGDWLHAARVRRSLELQGLGHLRLEAVAPRSPADLVPLLGQAAAVLATADCLTLTAKAVQQAGTGVPLLVESPEAPAGALAAIRRALGVAGTEPRVQVRSSWV